MKRVNLKAVLKLLLGLVLIAYMVWAALRWHEGNEGQMCERVDIVVEDSAKASFVSAGDIKEMLLQKKIYPEGREMQAISLREIETLLENHPFVLEAECYKSSVGVLHVGVKQRLPILRVMTGKDDYFIDAHGDKVNHEAYTADVVVASGSISTGYAKEKLANVGRLLAYDDFWNGQIEQINVLEDGAIELVPRVGNHIVAMGQPDDFESKLVRLREFYKRVLPKVGWNKYNRISLEYSNQIVCQKTR